MKFAGTEQEAREFVALRNKLLGEPRPGVHVGRGRHVDMPETWDGEGPKPPGWHGDDGPTFDGNEWSTPVNKGFSQAELAKNDGRLTGQERARFVQALNRVADDEPEAEPENEIRLEQKGK